MKSRIAATALLATIVSTAAARNVIVEWGGHSVHDYQVVSQLVPPYDDLYILITANSEPDKAWKFEAYDDSDPNQPPGYINYIRIADGVVVDDIHLSVIGDLGHVPPHVYGAADLKSLDLIAHGAETNTIDTIHISGDFGADGPMRAFAAGTLTIGRNLLEKRVGSLFLAVASGLRTRRVRAPDSTGPRAPVCGAAVASLGGLTSGQRVKKARRYAGTKA